MSARMSALDPPIPARAAGGVTSVDRALTLLQAFTVSTPTRTLSELAESAQQYKSTALRMLASLEHAGLVQRHADGRFSLGPAVARLGAVHSRTFSLSGAIEPVLSALVAATRESASFHMPQGEFDLCLYRVDSPQSVRDHLRAGELQPLGRSVAGRLLVAYAGAGGRRGARIRREQVFVADGDVVPELAAIVAPVFAPARLAGALMLTMPSVRFDPGHAAAVTAAAREITERLGGTFPRAGSDGRSRAE